jgi:hypothetical protein
MFIMTVITKSLLKNVSATFAVQKTMGDNQKTLATLWSLLASAGSSFYVRN